MCAVLGVVLGVVRLATFMRFTTVRFTTVRFTVATMGFTAGARTAVGEVMAVRMAVACPCAAVA